MITKTDCMKLILQQVPAFSERWQAHLCYWGDEEAGVCNDMAEFSHYVMDLIKNDELVNLPVIFDLVEQLMIDGSNEIQDVVATCFLENLLNAASGGRLDANKFAHLLKPESRAYCRAWDEFTGVYTEGLEHTD